MTFRFKYANFSILFLILLFIFGGKTNGYCQVFNYPEQDTDNWGIGLNVGLLHYRSNVNSGSTIGCGITISKIFTPVLGLRGDLMLGDLNGETALYSFKSHLIETTINGTVNVSKIIFGNEINKLINVYGLIGIGTTDLQGNTIEKSTDTVVKRYGYGAGKGFFGYQRNGVFNTGIGASFSFVYNLKATLEFDLKFMRGDMMGDPYVSKLDSYTYTSFSLIYQLPFARKFHWKCQ